MKLLALFGNAAVGKMTVGQELMKITDFRLFHNHLAIEPVIEVFGKYDSKIVEKIRQLIFEEFVKSNNYGLIFTFMWAFDQQEDWDYTNYLCDIFRRENGEITFDNYIKIDNTDLSPEAVAKIIKEKYFL